MVKIIVKIDCNAESIVNAIREFEMENGENYLEYGDFFVDSSVVMKFAKEKGYITEEQFNIWKEGFENNELGTEETFEVLLGEDREFEPYCIMYEEDDESKSFDDHYVKSLMVYGELICSDAAYYNKFISNYREKTKNDSDFEVTAEEYCEEETEAEEETEDEQ